MSIQYCKLLFLYPFQYFQQKNVSNIVELRKTAKNYTENAQCDIIISTNSNLPKRLSVMTVFFVRQAVIQID